MRPGHDAGHGDSVRAAFYENKLLFLREQTFGTFSGLSVLSSTFVSRLCRCFWCESG